MMNFAIQSSVFGDQIAADLRLRIVSCDLESGTHLVEGMLAEQYNVSRAPIREALRQLESEGLVESRKRGVFVVGLTDADVEELMQLRETLEILATRLAMTQSKDEDWAAMQGAIDRMKIAAAEGKSAEFAQADLEFHDAVYEASGHKRLAQTWKLYRNSFYVILQFSKRTPQEHEEGTASHEVLLDLLKAGQPESAVAAVSQHLRGTRKLFLDAVTQMNAEHLS